MNAALNMYEREEKVMCISGYSFPFKIKQPEPYFIFGGTSSWGWATWKRAWNKFDGDYERLYSKLITSTQLIKKFNFDNSYDYLTMLKECTEHEKPWDIRWYASVFLSGGYGLWPNKSLVQNIGHDNSGVHPASTKKFQHTSLAKQIMLLKIQVKENVSARKEIIRFFRNLNGQSILSKIRYKFFF